MQNQKHTIFPRPEGRDIQVFTLIILALALNGCSAFYGGITHVEWDSADGSRVEYTSGKELQGLEVEKDCDPSGQCRVVVKVQEANGVEAIKANAETMRQFIDASQDYARMFGGVP